jgi:hypothetical protein
MGPANRATGVTAIVEEPESLVRIAAGFTAPAESEKSGPETVTGMVRSWNKPPVLANTSTL